MRLKQRIGARESIGLASALAFALMLSGCTTDEHGRRIQHGDVAWIEKGRTTRIEVVERFGAPRFETLLQSSKTTTTTTTANVDGTSQTATTTVQVNEPPKGTKATYLHTRSGSPIPFYSRPHTTQFWLVYDDKGVVQDYGFVDNIH